MLSRTEKYFIDVAHLRGFGMQSRILLVSSILVGVVAAAPAARAAAVVLSDDFNNDGYHLNWKPSSLWTAPIGTVDLVGETPTGSGFDFYPGNGSYVDLDGSTNAAGALQSAASFAAGMYTLSFDLGGNARGDVAKTTTISLGDWSTALTLASDSPFRLYTYTFTTSGGKLKFADNTVGNQSIGNVLDNVTLTDPPSAPETSTWAMMALGFAGLGYAGLRVRKTAQSIA